MNEIILSNTVLPVICGCDLMAAGEPFYHADRVTDFHVLIYVTDGCIYVTENGTDHSVSEGELLFLKSGLRHFGNREIPKGTRWYFVHFILPQQEYETFIPSTAPLPRFLPIRSSVILPKKLKGLSGSAAERKIAALADYYNSSEPMKGWDVNIRLWELLSALAEEKTPLRDDSLSDRLCAFLSACSDRPFSSKSLESEFYLSYKHMAAVFKRERGITLQKYHNSLRMEKACKLLRSTLLTVGEISDRTGFSDMLYFSRCFREYTGMCPTEYRKKSRENY